MNFVQQYRDGKTIPIFEETRGVVFQGGPPLHLDLWFGNHQTAKPPPGGGFFRSRCMAPQHLTRILIMGPRYFAPNPDQTHPTSPTTLLAIDMGGSSRMETKGEPPEE